MAPLGPWPSPGARFPLAVAVSGGADSTALVLLASGWAAARGADLHALVVDHGLRSGSAAEAALVATRLRALGLRVRVLRVSGLSPGPGCGERARLARYAALDAACAELGVLDLLLGHHRTDQAETVAIRRRAGSGPAGLAGMARIAETAASRRLRPLLGIEPARLRATLLARGVPWVEDPSNRDPRFERVRVRADLDEAAIAVLADEGRRSGIDRRRRAAAAAAWLGRHASLRPEGFAVVRSWPPDDLPDPETLGALIRCVAGNPYPPPASAVSQLFADGSGATLAGAMTRPAGRLGPGGWLLLREPAAVAPPEPLRGRLVWDRRFLLSAPGNADGLLVGALGADRVPAPRRLPAAVLRTLPAIRRNGVLLAVPHLGWMAPGCPTLVRAAFRPPLAATDGSWFGGNGPFPADAGVPI